MSKESMADHAPHRPAEPSLASQRRALQERAEQLGATADELQAALEDLALQAEAVLHKLRGGSLH